MWESEDDVLRDIASLNDFWAPEDRESHKILYSIGRGLKTNEKPKILEKFIDSRSGEDINLENDTVNNMWCKSKGRGSISGSLFRTRLQLQQQLRLARPLGSGDEIIESYYGKIRSTENATSSIKPSDPESVAPNSKITSDNLKAELRPIKINKRIKGSRNSSSQANALVTSLLSKNKVDILKSEIKVEPPSNPNKGANQCVKNTKSDYIQKSSLNDLNFSSLTFSNKSKKKVNSVEKDLDFKESSNKGLHEKQNAYENFKIIDDNEKEEKEQLKKKGAKQCEENLHEIKKDFQLNINDFNRCESENDRVLKYRAFEERQNELRKICSKGTGNGSYDITPLCEFSGSREPSIFFDEDFPPLTKIF